LLVQAAAGLMEEARELSAHGRGGVAARGGGESVIYEREDEPGGFVLRARRPTGVESWRFVERGARQHLRQVRIVQEGREVLKLRFNPPLADVRASQDGESSSRMVASINGRPGYMAADVRIVPAEDGAKVSIEPRSPRWAAARPATSNVSFLEDGAVQVDTVIEPTAPWSFGDVECPEKDH
jgi:hypothetical protein